MRAVFVELPAFARHRSAGRQFWLFTLFDKDETTDMTARERAWLRQAIQAELRARRGR